jgi:GNAT superfamily N-acetyltransferase
MNFDFVFFDKKKHDRAGFDCGVPELNRYLFEQASQDVRSNYVKLVVATEENANKVLGFYTLSHDGLPMQDIPGETQRKLPKYERIPAVLLGRLAVDKAMQGQGLGAELMANAILRSLDYPSAWAVMVVDAKDEKASSFYKKFAFSPLADNPKHLYVAKKELERFAKQTLGYDVSKQEEEKETHQISAYSNREYGR